MSTACRITLRGLGFPLTALLVGLSAAPRAAAEERDASAAAIYVTDMRRCQPQAALAKHVKKDCWQLIPYETVDPDIPGGTMIGAASFVAAPAVTLPLDVTGWYSIYVGFWNPHYAYDGGTTVKIKLSDEPCFTRITEPEPVLDWGPNGNSNATYLSEALFQTADLTGRALQFGKLQGPFAQKVYIAYVKLVPLSAPQIADLQADRARQDTHLLQAVHDGVSYFWGNEYRTKEHIQELVEPYRYSDVGKLLWAVNYGEVTNYPTKVGIFWADSAPSPSRPCRGVTATSRERRPPMTASGRSSARGSFPWLSPRSTRTRWG
jgi:hypothetical protein